MRPTPDPQHIAAFLMVAWKGLVGLEEAVEGLGGEAADAARHSLASLGARFAQSADQYGFYDIARLATSMQRLALALPAASHPTRSDAVQLLRDTLNVLPMVLDNVAAEGSEDIPQIPGLQWRYDVEVPAAEDLQARTLRAEAPGVVDRSLQELRQEDPEMTGFFVLDARQHLDGMRARLDELRRPQPGLTADPEALNDFFRHAHTIKGAAFTVGCHAVGDLAHELEEIWVAIRRKDRPLTTDILDLSDRAASLLGQMVDRLDGVAGANLQKEHSETLAALKKLQMTAPRPLVAIEDGGLGPTRDLGAALRPDRDPRATVRADTAPDAGATHAADAPSPETRDEKAPEQSGTVPGEAGSRDAPATVGFALVGPPSAPVHPPRRPASPGQADAGDREELAPAPPVSVPAVSMTATPRAVSSGQAGRFNLRVDLQRLEKVLDVAGEVTVAHGTSVQQLNRLEAVHRQLDDCKERMLKTVRIFQDRHLHPVLDNPPDGRAEPAPQASSTATEPAATTDTSAAETSKLGSSAAEQFAELEFDRYDDFNILARRIGELSSDLSEIHHELEQVLVSARHSSLQVQNLTRRLRVGIGKVRMVPVGQLFARFSRLARKVADEAGKHVVVELEGEQVEIDNAIIDRIAEPLTHLVQNAVFHGIEGSDQRRMIGKNAVGTLRFAATAKGRRVRLEIQDDGAGIDVERLRRRAVELGLRRADQVAGLSDDEALSLIYLPGLTTTRRATSAAGRGVGMDAVRHSVARLGGEVTARTELGAGTTFTLELPVSLLVTEALVVRVGRETFALPLPQIDRVVHLFEDDLIPPDLNPQDQNPQDLLPKDLTPKDLTAEDLTAEDLTAKDLAAPSSEDRAAGIAAAKRARFDDRPWDLLSMAERLGLEGSGPAEELPGLVAFAALVRHPTPTALLVDEVIGIEELVVKPLGPFLEGVRFFSGATLDTQGRVLLMVDVASLVSDEMSPFPSAPTPPMALPETPPRLLLVDDSLSVRRVLGRSLQRRGYEVFTARDGAEALELLLDLSFDGVITDLEMPRMSGYELIEDLRNRASTRDTPVWVVTTRAGARHADLARRLGAVGYLAKPVDADLLIEQLEQVLGQSVLGRSALGRSALGRTVAGRSAAEPP